MLPLARNTLKLARSKNVTFLCEMVREAPSEYLQVPRFKGYKMRPFFWQYLRYPKIILEVP